MIDSLCVLPLQHCDRKHLLVDRYHNILALGERRDKGDSYYVPQRLTSTSVGRTRTAQHALLGKTKEWNLDGDCSLAQV